ncbi:NAD-dependent epimerase/dehydratase family protein [Streptomyces sp. NPDC005955]|uniref:NAD-dependent epimerase/dehydratase family protein n=1 Tax=Streptomyces sp. NPDC005955 TaxID=3364738 RepID=UPI0036D0A528
MKLLILGGSEFAGRAVAEEAVRRGWEVTAFNRGRHPAPDGVTTLTGDRTAPGGLSALANGAWDAVVDTWSAAPRAVRDTAALLADRVGRYTYVSTKSVYAWAPPAGANENHPTVTGDPDAEATAYAEDKRGAELAVEAAFGPERSLLLRAGLIIGPYENVGRLPWWLNRIARGGEVLAPGPRDLPLQYVDVRDLAVFALDATVAGLNGPYDTVSPSGHTTTGELLDACAAVTGSRARLRWIDPEVILKAGVEPWTELPIWAPPDSEVHAALHGSDVSRAVGAGLVCRPAAETVADTWTWLTSLGGAAPQRTDRPAVRLSAETEARILREVADGGDQG